MGGVTAVREGPTGEPWRAGQAQHHPPPSTKPGDPSSTRLALAVVQGGGFIHVATPELEFRPLANHHTIRSCEDGFAMVTTTPLPPLVGGASLRLPMSAAEYQDLGELRHSEYADGLLIVNPPNRPHERAVRRLTRLLDPLIPPTHEFFTGWGWRLEDGRERQPDLMIADRDATGDTILVSPPPLLIVEVTSPSTTDTDHGAKLNEYGWAGASWYWIVDPTEIVVFGGRDGRLVEVQRVTTTAIAAGPFPVLLDPTTLRA